MGYSEEIEGAFGSFLSRLSTGGKAALAACSDPPTIIFCANPSFHLALHTKTNPAKTPAGPAFSDGVLMIFVVLFPC